MTDFWVKIILWRLLWTLLMIFTLKIVLVTSLSWGKESGNKINLVTYNSYSPKEKSRIFYKLVQNNPDPWISFTELLSPDNDVAKTRSNVNISRVVGQDFFSCWSLLFLRIAIFFFAFLVNLCDAIKPWCIYELLWRCGKSQTERKMVLLLVELLLLLSQHQCCIVLQNLKKCNYGKVTTNILWFFFVRLKNKSQMYWI